MAPTRIYVKPVLSLLSVFSSSRAAPVKGIAHITGGAFYSKATKIIPDGCGMVLRKKSWPVPRIFKIIQENGGIPEREMCTVFNMGIGMILVLDKHHAARVLYFLGKNKNFHSYIIGEIVKAREKMVMV